MSDAEKPIVQDITLWTKEAADDILAASPPKDPLEAERAVHTADEPNSRHTSASSGTQSREPSAVGEMSSGTEDSATKLGGAQDTAVEHGGRTAERADNVKELPLVALAVTGLLCLVLGAMLGRR